MTNGYEHLLDMCDSGTTLHGDTDYVSESNDQVVLLYGAGNQTGLLATEKFREIGADVVVVDEPDYRAVVMEQFEDDIDFLEIDPRDAQSIEDATEKFRERYDQLDVLASVKSASYDPSGTNVTTDQTYAVNHLAIYRLCRHLDDMLFRARTLIPVHPIINRLNIELWNREQPDDVEDAFVRSQYANAALVVGLHIYHWDRTTNAYDPGIVVHEGSLPHVDRATAPSEPDIGAARLVHISSESTAGILRGGYYADSLEEIEEQLDEFEDEFSLWDVPTPEYHKLPISQADCETVLDYDAGLCDFDADWYKTDAWWLDADRGPTGY